ncbi:hypothetical protein [Novosphingobium sp. MD-1]|uniref:hypothetical protein n=1 Tax=Novosphingobium sp. MD-1 TaxID=1630648 RepID=UPI00061BB40A|nr:hypothetical protein [Novosphingobium sp. MD-1]GAO52973.1 hypothetical protein NMD1_02630 [Novosphingobium sp. MD-1]
MKGSTSPTLLRTVLRAPLVANAAVAGAALRVARFLTQMGSTPAETFFWRMGAGISAFGAGVVAASEGGLVAALLTARAWRLPGGAIAIGLHGLLAFLAA